MNSQRYFIFGQTLFKKLILKFHPLSHTKDGNKIGRSTIFGVTKGLQEL